MISEKYRDHFNEIRDLYNTAESDIKNIGRDKHELVVTGINQCRYAGQHLLRALTASEEGQIEEELTSAKKHVQRAIYDTNDSGIQYYISMIDQIRILDFPTVDFSQVVPNYSDIIQGISAARTLTEATVSSLENRENFYSEAREHVETLRKNYKLLVESRPDLVKAAQKDNRDKRRTWAFMCGAGASVLTAVLAVLAMLAM